MRHKIVFEFPYEEAKVLGFSRGCFSKVIQDLVNHGFIDYSVRGGLLGDGAGNSRFLLSGRWESMKVDSDGIQECRRQRGRTGRFVNPRSRG